MRLKKLLIYYFIIICNLLSISATTSASTIINNSIDSGNSNNINQNNNISIESRAWMSPESYHPGPIEPKNTIKDQSNADSTSIKRPDKVKKCPSLHIINDLKSFQQLKGCNIIEGSLTIALIHNRTQPYESKDYENITFPQLIEITDYLLLSRVQGLSTLSRLFPNLAVIRGNRLVENYALIIYEMMHLQTINLPKLTDILRGSVRIEKNPNLCYVNTVNWENICERVFSPHFMKDNNPRCNDRCPDNCQSWIPKHNREPLRIQGDVKELGSEHNRSVFCWSDRQCHSYCPGGKENTNLLVALDGHCCHLQCAGGCYESDDPRKCFSCRSVSEGDECVKHCSRHLFAYEGNCITEQECTSRVERLTSSKCASTPEDKIHVSNFKAIRSPDKVHAGICQAECPPGSEEDPIDKNQCRPCDLGKCRKICTPSEDGKSFVVTNVNSLKELSGCNVINGSLEISVKGGANVIHELEAAFQGLQEIKGFLKIQRSFPIITLDFLTNLRAINGSELDRGDYSLLIVDNPNLKELFKHNQSTSDQKKLAVRGGRIFVHLNPKLCPHRIQNLKTYATVADWDEKDVSIHTNGDKEACETGKLEVQFVSAEARSAKIRFAPLKMNDPRSLLYYLVNYREATAGNVTMFDGRDPCNSQNDAWTTAEIPPPSSSKLDEFQEVSLTNVKPSTRYALYVNTLIISADSQGGLSEMMYFSTGPDTPTAPRQLESVATGHDSVTVSWLPPTEPNGVITSYTITIKKIPELTDSRTVNFCDYTKLDSIVRDEPSKAVSVPSTSDTPVVGPDSCSKSTRQPDAEAALQAEIATFQDIISDIIYIKQECLSSTPSQPTRRKRAPPQRDAPAPGTTTEVSLSASAFKPDSRISYTVGSLDHFGLYSIEVAACHGDFKSENVSPSQDYNRCSVQAITSVRTLPIESYDRVRADSIVFHAANESQPSHIIRWTPPERPNGLVLGYRVRYRPKNGQSDVWTEGCISSSAYGRDVGFVLSDISPGTYLFSVSAVSMFGQRLWSEPELEFEIARVQAISPVALGVLVIFSAISVAIAIALGTYYYQKKRHELTNGLVYASVNPDYIQYDPDEWEVDKSNVVLGDHVGTGAFGMVYKGQLITESGTFKCAIKTVPATSTAKQRMDFLREASIMKQFDTFHVVKLMGVVSTTNPVYVIMEYMEHGDLKSFLRNVREAHQRDRKTLVDGIYLMAAQIADGMAYLASKKFVHRDLAARNCMVGENRIVKIGDFGLTRDIYVNDYYRRDTHGRLPVRWMAPESLLDNLYTSASDVWSFGIVVWEIVTFSAYPYQGQSNDEVIKRVSAGFTMSRPENCPDKLYNIMQKCWRKEQSERPTFGELVEELLPETEDKLYPNCFYQRHKTSGGGGEGGDGGGDGGGGEANAQASSEENNSGAESYPLLSWTSNRINGLTNGAAHVQSDTV